MTPVNFIFRLKLTTLKNILMALEFTDANFQTVVLDSDKLTVVDFWAEWCPPCRAIAPIIEELSTQYSGKINVGKINVDHNPNISITYGITAIPVILYIKDGKVVDKQVGAAPKAVFERKIQAHL
ncbi:MAG TPA: thioredoxin [Chitinophagaceae bacterium]|nr:thioredoxin [Chitinophagaceae bacterium]